MLLLAYGLAVLLIPPDAKGAEPDSAAFYEIEVDDLEDWNHVYQRSESLVLQSLRDSAEDRTVVGRKGLAGEYLLYRAKGRLRSFTVYAYGQTAGSGHDHPMFLISADGSEFHPVTPRIYEENADQGTAIAYEASGLPGTTKYLKIVFSGTSAERSPLIGKVVLNGPSGVTASVPSGTVPYGKMVMLNRAGEGDTVYYTTDGSDPRYSPTRKRYIAPVPILSETVLKAVAVNHSGTGKSAASRVSTWRYVPEPQAAPSPGLTDHLDDFGKTASRANLYIAKEDPGYFGNDKARAARATTKPGHLLYRLDADIVSFTIYAGYFMGVSFEPLGILASADGKTYREIDAEWYPVGYSENNWQQFAFEAVDLPEGNRYLKIELRGSAKAWTPQIMKVFINRSTASVKVSATQDGDAATVTLATATDGARIYYRLNKGPDFLPYSEPLRLKGYNVLEAYAVKDGMEPSPIRRYNLNFSGEIAVDRYGQVKSADFPGKVTSDEELRADAEADEAYYGSLEPPADRDRYGGLAGSAERFGLKATGFFAIQRMGDRVVMTTPEGNLYFSLAVNGITALETYTRVTGREHQFEEIPPYESEYRGAYFGKDNFSFFMANKYRKTGVFPTEHDIYMEAVERLKKWGFNGVGGHSPAKYGEAGKFPYVRMLPLSGMDWAKVPGISIFDIFAPDAAAKIDRAFAQALPPHAEDRMLIGYFIDNEYEYHKFYSHVPKLKASSAAIKGKLAETLEEKYGTIGAFNDAWETNFRSFEDLKEAELSLRTSQAWRDMDEFFRFYLETFYKTVAETFRKYDPNHLLLGTRWITTVFRDDKIRGMLAETEGRYMDVISINDYAYAIDAGLLRDVHEKSGGRPVLISEFGYGTGEQGLEPLMKNAAADQFQRGMRYRNYVEGAASLPFVVGTHLFNYVDQAALGRYWEGEWGERYNSGLVNVADRPYKDYLKGVMDTNYEIYKVMLGERSKFFYDFSKK